ncbi:hypothetical protein [Pseudomonas aeruginosa]|uniref:hypothetical protein n=1 Tax=Pseudomonas aeruginosa TaxID=287 RepID=UPI0034E08FB9
MLNKLPFAALLSAVILATGCTTHLSEGQKRELDAFDQKGLKVEEKSVGTAAVLGVFPMAGYLRWASRVGIHHPAPLPLPRSALDAL